MEDLNTIINRVIEQYMRHSKIILRKNFTKNTKKQIQYTKEFINDYNIFIEKKN